MAWARRRIRDAPYGLGAAALNARLRRIRDAPYGSGAAAHPRCAQWLRRDGASEMRPMAWARRRIRDAPYGSGVAGGMRGVMLDPREHGVEAIAPGR